MIFQGDDIAGNRTPITTSWDKKPAHPAGGHAGPPLRHRNGGRIRFVAARQEAWRDGELGEIHSAGQECPTYRGANRHPL
jgi:hypothetical protein